jgi:hypothetical protein
VQQWCDGSSCKPCHQPRSYHPPTHPPSRLYLALSLVLSLDRCISTVRPGRGRAYVIAKERRELSLCPILSSRILRLTLQVITMPTFNSLPLKDEPKSVHTYDISATSINGCLGTFTKATRSEPELETWLTTAPSVQGQQHADPPTILRLMQVLSSSSGSKARGLDER